MDNEDEGEEGERLGKFRFDRRSRNNFKDWAVIITLIANLSGLVWTAAKWSAAIDMLRDADGKKSIVLDGLGNRVNTLESRVNLLDYQVNINRTKLETIK